MSLSKCEQFNLFTQATLCAGARFEVWESLAIARGDDEFVDKVRDSNLFDYVETSCVGLRVAAMLSLSHVYDTNPRAANLMRFWKSIKGETGVFDSSDLARVDQIFELLKPGLTALKNIRNSDVAHKSVKDDVDQVYDEAGLTPAKFKEMVMLTSEVLTVINKKFQVQCVNWESFDGYRRSADKAIDCLSSAES